MIGISSQPLFAKKLNILHSSGEHRAKLENNKDFESSLGVFGDTYTVTTNTFCPFTGYSAAKTSPHESEALGSSLASIEILTTFKNNHWTIEICKIGHQTRDFIRREVVKYSIG
jgi:hypothetical protein